MTNATATWEVPSPCATVDVALDDGSATTVRRHGNPAGPRLVLSHGTGLAADLYVPFWSALLRDFDLFLYDIRNHGWNAVGPLTNHSLPVFVRDHDRILAAIDERFGRKPAIGVYHSLAAVVAMAATTSSASGCRAHPHRAQRYSALVLFDPPLYMRDVDDGVFFDLAAIAAVKTRRKTRRFASLADFEARAARASKFARVVPGLHGLMARTMLRRRTDGAGYELCCPPEYEARLFEDMPRWTRTLCLARIACPVKVIASDLALPYAYVPSLDDDELDAVEYESIPETGHFLQLEKPAECVAAMCAYLGQRGHLGDSALEDSG